MLSAYFTQDLEVKVVSDSVYTWQYLIKCEGRAFINNLESGQCTPVTLNGEQQGIAKTFMGKEQRITESEARSLLESGCPIFEKVGNEFRMLV